MSTNCIEAMAAMRRDISVEFADTAAALEEAQRLRFDVFCSEHQILTGRSGIEQDHFDDHARHVVLRRRVSGEVVGTVRLVPYRDSNPTSCFPVQRVCSPELLADVPLRTTGEISRFALSKGRREMGCPSDGLMRLALMQGVLAASLDLGLTHWCAAMEPSLLRLLRMASIHFQPVGPLVEYYGLRQPAVGAIESIMARGRRERPEIYAYVTACMNAGRQVEAERIAA